MMRSRVTTLFLALLLVGCAGKSKATDNRSGPGDRGGAGSSGTGGTSGAGAGSSSTGGTSGAGPSSCTTEDRTCEASRRCVLDLFGEPRVFPAGPAPSSLALGDLNGDALLDVAIADEV